VNDGNDDAQSQPDNSKHLTGAPRSRKESAIEWDLTMSSMKITLNQNPLFSWESDQDTIDRILEDFPRAAEVGGRTPEAFAGDILKRLPDVLRSDDDVMQEIATMGVLWWILQFETSNAEHPGKGACHRSAVAAGCDLRRSPR
jgi:hypothetical protein